jgi:hypothetical protein
MREVFYLHPDGSQQNIVHRPVLAHLRGRRVSRVVPHWLPYCVLFDAIRWWWGDDSKAAEWTRSWRCRWQTSVFVEIGETLTLRYLGVFPTRREALAAEVRCLEQLLESAMSACNVAQEKHDRTDPH